MKTSPESQLPEQPSAGGQPWEGAEGVVRDILQDLDPTHHLTDKDIQECVERCGLEDASVRDKKTGEILQTVLKSKNGEMLYFEDRAHLEALIREAIARGEGALSEGRAGVLPTIDENALDLFDDYEETKESQLGN